MGKKRTGTYMRYEEYYKYSNNILVDVCSADT